MNKHYRTGFQSTADDHRKPPLSLDQLLIKFPLSTFFCRFQGDAMKGAGINHNDLLVIEKRSDYLDGQIVLAFCNGDRLVRYLEHFPEGRMLCPANVGHKTIPLTEGAQIFGVVAYSVTTHLKLKILTEAPEAM
jgi:DNA polymerase V